MTGLLAQSTPVEDLPQQTVDKTVRLRALGIATPALFHVPQELAVVGEYEEREDMGVPLVVYQIDQVDMHRTEFLCLISTYH